MKKLLHYLILSIFVGLAAYFYTTQADAASFPSNVTINYDVQPSEINATTPGGVPGQLIDLGGGKFEFRPLRDPADLSTGGQFSNITTPPPGIATIQPTTAPTSAPQLTVYGSVFKDTNNNCTQDTGEEFLSGWEVSRGFSEISNKGFSVPSGCQDNRVTTTSGSGDSNYSMSFDPNSKPPCATFPVPFQVNAKASSGRWQVSPSCGGIGEYASDDYMFFSQISSLSNVQNNRLRVDFPMTNPTPDLMAEAVGIDGAQGGNGQNRTVIARNETVLLSSMVMNGGKEAAKASTGRFCIDNPTDCLINDKGKIAEIPLPALKQLPAWGGGDPWWYQAATEWKVNASPGTHSIWFCADVYNTSGEPSTAKLNNCGSHSIIIVGEAACNSTCNTNEDCSGAQDGCTACMTDSNGQKTCQQPPSCGTTCTQASDCAGARNGCTACVPNQNGQGSSCQQPPSCGAACDRDNSSACAGVRTGSGADCSSCRPNSSGQDVCQPPEIACGSACNRNDASACAGVRTSSGGDCSACLPNAGGSYVCQPPVTCGTTCTQASDCAGARNGCTACVPNANGQGSSCQQPPSCGTTCTQASDCAGARNGCTACVPNANGQGSSCQTPPSCGSACARDDQCTGARNSSGTACSDCRPNANGQQVCQPVVACNSACTRDSDCDAGDAKAAGCTSCLPGSNGQLTCQKNIACNSACTKDSDCNAGDALKNGCTSCIANKCQTFNEDMCKCDGITFTQIASGQEVTVTNFEKVEGPNIMKAKVQDMTFFFTAGKGTNAPVIAKSQPIKATVISQTADKVRYQAQWKVKIPENVKPGVDYQIFAQVKCVKQSEMAMASTNRAVLAETTSSNQGFFGRIGSFFNRLFGNDNQTSIQSTAPTTTTTPTSTSGRESLQLRSFNPNVNASASCRFVNFNFKQ